jgi:hypothetical protein
MANMGKWHWYDPPILFRTYLVVLIVGYALLRTPREVLYGRTHALGMFVGFATAEAGPLWARNQIRSYGRRKRA